jgi:hypothetical protein
MFLFILIFLKNSPQRYKKKSFGQYDKIKKDYLCASFSKIYNIHIMIKHVQPDKLYALYKLNTMFKTSFLSTLCTLSLLMTSCNFSSAQPSLNNGNMPIATALDIPKSVTFCGETISLERYDMRERYDREQLAFMYMHSSSLQLIKRANRYFPIIEPILAANGVPDDFKYLAAIESMLDPRAYSSAKAAGLWQFLASTGKSYGLEINTEVDERYHIEKETIAACKYLKEAYSKYGDWATVAASYNAGMGRISSEQTKQLVESSFDMLLVSETSRYVFRIMAAKAFLENPQKFGFKVKKEQLYHTVGTEEVEVSTAVANWAEWAQKRGINYSQLKDFNIWLRDNKLTNKSGKTYIIKLPKAEDLNFDASKIKVHVKITE